MKKAIFLAGLLGLFLAGPCFAESAEGPYPLLVIKKSRPADTQPSGPDLSDVSGPISDSLAAFKNYLATRKRTSPAGAAPPTIIAHLRPKDLPDPMDAYPSQAVIDGVKILMPGQTAAVTLDPKVPKKILAALIEDSRIDDAGRMRLILWARHNGVTWIDDDNLRKAAAKPGNSPGFREAVRTFIKTKTWKDAGPERIGV